jgi:hypothetical protein
MTTRSLIALLIAIPSAFSAVGCDSRSESGPVGKTATVEYRPVAAAGGTVIQKQRSGVLKKVTSDWVSIDEQGNEIWIPRDMVLEIRMDKK